MTDEPVDPGSNSILDSFIPHKYVKAILVGILMALATLGVLVVQYPDIKAFQTAMALVSALAGVLGIASPGLHKTTVKLFVVGAALGLLMLPTQASAASCFGFTDKIDCNAGATVAALMLRTDGSDPVSLAPGLGVQVNVSLPQLQLDIGAQTWNIVALQAMLFGSLVSAPGGGQFGMAAPALGLCFFSGIGCASVGHDLVTTNGGFGGGSWFFLLSGSFNFGLAPKTEAGKMGLSYQRKAMTVYF